MLAVELPLFIAYSIELIEHLVQINARRTGGIYLSLETNPIKTRYEDELSLTASRVSS